MSEALPLPEAGWIRSRRRSSGRQRATASTRLFLLIVDPETQPAEVHWIQGISGVSYERDFDPVLSHSQRRGTHRKVHRVSAFVFLGTPRDPSSENLSVQPQPKHLSLQLQLQPGFGYYACPESCFQVIANDEREVHP